MSDGPIGRSDFVAAYAMTVGAANLALVNFAANPFPGVGGPDHAADVAVLVALVIELEDADVRAPTVDAGMGDQVCEHKGSQFRLPFPVPGGYRLAVNGLVLGVIAPAPSVAAVPADGLQAVCGPLPFVEPAQRLPSTACSAPLLGFRFCHIYDFRTYVRDYQGF